MSIQCISEPVFENENAKIPWDFTIQMDKRLPHNRPDIVVVDMKKRECHIITFLAQEIVVFC